MVVPLRRNPSPPRVDADGFTKVRGKGARQGVESSETPEESPAPAGASMPSTTYPGGLHWKMPQLPLYKHRVAQCKLPTRCFRCRGFRHLARDCKRPRGSVTNRQHGGCRNNIRPAQTGGGRAEAAPSPPSAEPVASTSDSWPRLDGLAANNHGLNPEVRPLFRLDKMDAVEMRLRHALLAVAPDEWQDLHHAALDSPDFGNESFVVRQIAPGIFLVLLSHRCAGDQSSATNPSASGEPRSPPPDLCRVAPPPA